MNQAIRVCLVNTVSLMILLILAPINSNPQ